MKKYLSLCLCLVISFLFMPVLSWGEFDGSDVIKQGLLGAGTGAIAAGASGGKAGKGALIGAGTGVVGGVLLDALTGEKKKSSEEAVYSDEDGEYYEYEEEPSSSSGAGKIIGQGLVGAGTGAIAAGASGGKAGEGALIGAGTNVIGNALLDSITGSDKKPVKKRYIKKRKMDQEESKPSKKIIRKYDEKGNLISEEEIVP